LAFQNSKLLYILLLAGDRPIMVTVRDIMHTDIISVAPNALIEDALDLMLKHQVSGLPVIDALELLCDDSHQYWPVEPVAGLMTSHVESVSPCLLVSELAHRFRDGSVRRLPVVEAGRMVGIVSRRDLIKTIRAERRHCSELTLNLTSMLSAASPDHP